MRGANPRVETLTPEMGSRPVLAVAGHAGSRRTGWSCKVGDHGGPRVGDLGTVCNDLLTVGDLNGVIGRVRSFVDKPLDPGAEWLVESA
jgi:hypothetical protein